MRRRPHESSAIEVARFRLRLVRPIRFAGVSIDHREGFFVRIDGKGIGEVTPMPGVHRESAEECLRVLAERGAGDPMALPPPLAFGVSCAVALNRNEPVLKQPMRATVGVNALFSGSADDARDSIERGALSGYRTVKVKVSRAEDAATVECLARGLPITTRLRLDANRSLSFEDARTVLSAASPVRVEYIEEPLAEPLRMPELHHATGHWMALDESLVEAGLRAALEVAPGISTHVLKPSLHGSIASVRERAERTARQTLRTTVSNALETGYTLRLLARLTTWLPNAQGDHGLATSGLLVGDPAPPLAIERGRVRTDGRLPDLGAAPGLRFEPLEAALRG